MVEQSGGAARHPAGTSISARIDRLRIFGRRNAYLWREGVRWRRRTYSELHARIHACAARLAVSGVAPGTPVLIQGPAGADWVEALLATFLLGGVAVPLDEATPDSFRFEVARRSAVKLLVAPREVAAPDGCAHVVMGDWPASTFAPFAWAVAGASRLVAADPCRPPERTPPTAASHRPVPGSDRVTEADGAVTADVSPSVLAWDPEATAEWVFTSGTTGEPKGVVLTHGNLASDFHPVERAFLKRERYVRPLGELRFVSTLPLSHMFGQALNVFLPLFMGLTVVFVPARPRDVLEAARRCHAWGLFTVPRLLDLLGAEVRRMLREEGKLESYRRRQERFARWPFYLQPFLFARVRRLFGWRFRLLVSGGAALPEEVQHFWERSGYLVVQGYGLTETAPIVSISNPFERRAGSVGKPLGIQEVKLGPDGEVIVRGPNVTRGYVGVAAPADPEGWFRTGDIGEFDEHGRLRIRGRLKDVIVTAEGENVYPADVEAALARTGDVRETCVLGLPGPGGDRVHAVLLLEDSPDAAACVRKANTALQPKQRIKDYTVWREGDLPRTATGKVRKALLREQILVSREETAQPGGGAAAPGAEAVRRLVALVARVEPARVESSTRLVEGLGFASLDLVELAVAFEEEFGVVLPEDHLNEATVGDLERAVLEVQRGGAVAMRTNLASGGEGGVSGSEVASSSPPTSPSGETQPTGAALAAGKGALRMPRWARWAPVRWIRRLFDEVVQRPFVFIFTRPRVIGRRHLREAEPPFLFVANHHGYMDTTLFKVALPFRLRGRIAPAMTTRYQRVYFGEIPGGTLRYWMEWIQAHLAEFFWGTWPLPETSRFRSSLSFAGELADGGESLLIFPEGRHVPEGMMERFRGGIGIFARDLRMPVIPAYVEGTAAVLPDKAYWPRFGKTRLVLGAPIRIDPDADPAEVTRRLEEAVRTLMKVTRGVAPGGAATSSA